MAERHSDGGFSEVGFSGSGRFPLFLPFYFSPHPLIFGFPNCTTYAFTAIACLFSSVIAADMVLSWKLESSRVYFCYGIACTSIGPLIFSHAQDTSVPAPLMRLPVNHACASPSPHVQSSVYCLRLQSSKGCLFGVPFIQ